MSIAVSIPIVWQTAPNPLLKQPQIIWHRHHPPAPPLQLQLHKNPESDSPSFIRFPPEDNDSSKRPSLGDLPKQDYLGISPSKKEKWILCALPLLFPIQWTLTSSSLAGEHSILFYSLFRGYLQDAHLKYSCHSIHSPASLWRPWLMTRKDAQTECRRTKLACVSFFHHCNSNISIEFPSVG